MSALEDIFSERIDLDDQDGHADMLIEHGEKRFTNTYPGPPYQTAEKPDKVGHERCHVEGHQIPCSEMPRRGLKSQQTMTDDEIESLVNSMTYEEMKEMFQELEAKRKQKADCNCGPACGCGSCQLEHKGVEIGELEENELHKSVELGDIEQGHKDHSSCTKESCSEAAEISRQIMELDKHHGMLLRDLENAKSFCEMNKSLAIDESNPATRFIMEGESHRQHEVAAELERQLSLVVLTRLSLLHRLCNPYDGVDPSNELCGGNEKGLGMSATAEGAGGALVAPAAQAEEEEGKIGEKSVGIRCPVCHGDRFNPVAPNITCSYCNGAGFIS